MAKGACIGSENKGGVNQLHLSHLALLSEVLLIIKQATCHGCQGGIVPAKVILRGGQVVGEKKKPR